MKYRKHKIKILLLAVMAILLVFIGADCQDNGTFIGIKEVQDLVLPELTVKDFCPPDGEANVAVDAVLAVRFSESIKFESIVPDSISLQYINPDLDSEQAKIHYEWSLAANGQDLAIKPIGNILVGEIVEVVLSCDFKGQDDQELIPVSESFIEGVCYTSQFQVADGQ